MNSGAICYEARGVIDTPEARLSTAAGRTGQDSPPDCFSAAKKVVRVLILACVLAAESLAQGDVYRSAAFAVTDASVRQGPYEAVAVSPDVIATNYPRAAREVIFKFSINSEENEFAPGTDRTIYLRPASGRIVTPVYTFGELDPPLTPAPRGTAAESEEGQAAVTFRLDMRHVMRSFRERGYYDPPNGRPIKAAEFEGVYVIGNTEPLSWNFRALRPGSRLELRDPDGDGVYTVTLPFEATYSRPLDERGRAVWRRRLDLSRFPQLTSSQPLVDALHRLSLEELLELTREDGAITAGAKWPDVWTRDTSWGAMLAFALIAPEQVRRSLMVKVDADGRIIQDTGTGGSWPVSTDRMAWALAAWELYCVEGDRAWLRSAYDVIRRSAEADLLTAYDPETGLFRGESSFLDWREQSYPRWMDAKDIYQSQALGTNAIHYATYRILAEMARTLGEPAARYDDAADSVRRGMNEHLWQPRRGYYGQYRYGRNYPSLSPRAEGLGEALCIIYGVAPPGQRELLARRMPVVPFGVPSFWPYIPDVPPYHNAGIWPQVVGFWAWASAEAGNAAGVEHSLASIYRAAALFLTNKENMVASTGHFEGTELNSDRLIGSVAGNLATVYRVLFGVRARPDRLVFAPFVPRPYGGERTLRGLRYRDAVLTVTVRGFGSAPARVLLDGHPVARAEIPASLKGEHRLEIVLNDKLPPSSINLVENRYAPETPRASLEGEWLVWEAVPGAARYAVYRNGCHLADTRRMRARVTRRDGLDEYQVMAADARGFESFLSAPVRVAPDAATVIVEAEGERPEKEVGGFTGSGYVSLTTEKNLEIKIPVVAPAAGLYSLDVRYANGSGPVNSSDKAAVRSLSVDGRRVGAWVMPQRGTNLWDDWGYSNPLRVRLSAGAHTVRITYTESDRNMNRAVNRALLDHMRLTRLAPEPAGRQQRCRP